MLSSPSSTVISSLSPVQPGTYSHYGLTQESPGKQETKGKSNTVVEKTFCIIITLYVELDNDTVFVYT